MEEVTVIEKRFLKTVNVIQGVKNQAHSSLRKTKTQLTKMLTAYILNHSGSKAELHTSIKEAIRTSQLI
jgi:hypothetical protein